MLIGDPQVFGIECYHDPLPNDPGSVFGRMCIWVAGQPLGDINETSCMLNVTEGHLQHLLERLDSLDEPTLRSLGDREAFDFLDRALYLDDARTDEQIAEDSRRFGKFDLLTNGGESFDCTKSFVIGERDRLRILFEDEQRGFASARIGRATVILTVRGFLSWVAGERKNAG
jgi:hypothetical protein